MDFEHKIQMIQGILAGVLWFSLVCRQVTRIIGCQLLVKDYGLVAIAGCCDVWF
jgi:hypothetical protein